jgi:hypothetical protein
MENETLSAFPHGGKIMYFETGYPVVFEKQ